MKKLIESLPIYLWLYSPSVDLGRFFTFLIYTQTAGLLERGIPTSQGRYLHPEQQTQNEPTLTSMPQVGFERTIPVFERVKTVCALDWAAGHCDGLIESLRLKA
jgi:hypothetical protein